MIVKKCLVVSENTLKQCILRIILWALSQGMNHISKCAGERPRAVAWLGGGALQAGSDFHPRPPGPVGSTGSTGQPVRPWAPLSTQCTL